MSEHIIYILAGSNLGNRMDSLKHAADMIVQQGHMLLASSPVYETAPWGPIPQPAFLNQVLKIKSSMLPNDLMNHLLQIEKQMGRIRSEKMGPRVIDLDILFYDSIIHQSAIVTIPHPLLQDRRFVLQPLCDLSPDYIHPVFKKSVKQLLLECSDPLMVIQAR